MLDVFIIEEIKRRERDAERRREEQRPRKELPLPTPRIRSDEEKREEPSERGVVIIDYSIEGYGF